MRTVRTCVFETNSSSEHALAMCLESDYEKYKNGELLFSCNQEKLVTFADVYEYVKERADEIKNTTDERLAQFVNGYLPDFENTLTLDKFTQIVKSMDGVYSYRHDKDGQPISYSAKRSIDSDEKLIALVLEYRYHTADEYISWVEDEFYQTFTTPSGEKIVAFGYYGHT